MPRPKRARGAIGPGSAAGLGEGGFEGGGARPLGDVAREVVDAGGGRAVGVRSGDLGAARALAAGAAGEAPRGAAADGPGVAPGVAASFWAGGRERELGDRGERSMDPGAEAGGFIERDAGHRPTGLAAPGDRGARARGLARGVAGLGDLVGVDAKRRDLGHERLDGALGFPVAGADSERPAREIDGAGRGGAPGGQGGQARGASLRLAFTSARSEALALAAAARSERDHPGGAARGRRRSRSGDDHHEGHQRAGEREATDRDPQAPPQAHGDEAA